VIQRPIGTEVLEVVLYIPLEPLVLLPLFQHRSLRKLIRQFPQAQRKPLPQQVPSLLPLTEPAVEPRDLLAPARPLEAAAPPPAIVVPHPLTAELAARVHMELAAPPPRPRFLPTELAEAQINILAWEALLELVALHLVIVVTHPLTAELAASLHMALAAPPRA